ncbi:N-acyl-D-amino-acid deacylase family protein [Sphingomonas koreensis]
MSRRLVALFRAGTALGLAALAMAPAPAAETESVDLLIRGGTIYTGSAEPFTGEIAIRGDRIVYVGPKAPVRAARTIEAKGLVVAPGFVDPHAHVETMLQADDPARRLVLPFLMQGVTTAFIGNDGGGGTDVAKTLSTRSGAVGINFATYVGFGPVRKQVVGEAARAATPGEIDAMQRIVADAMCNGALGLSAGLFYAPQSFAATDEVIALAREAGKRGGFYDTHLRNESSFDDGLVKAIDEALRIGREGAVPVHIAHLKLTGEELPELGAAVIARIERAQAAGQKVHADQYPWAASSTALSALIMPRWAQDGGRTAMLARFGEPQMLARIREEMRENLRRRRGPAAVLVTSGAADVRGKTLADIATKRGVDPIDAAIDLLRTEEVSIVSFSQDEAMVEAIMRRPWVMTGSDASAGHPRMYGSYARKYAHYVKDRSVISLRDFIERSSTLAADRFGLEGRGHLRAGAFADVVLFDPARYAARADYVQPALFAKGVDTVIVNGVIAVEDGAPTGAAAGRALPRTPPPGACPR